MSQDNNILCLSFKENVMALSKKTQEILTVAMADKKSAKELGDSASRKAATVAAIADPSTATAEDVANKVNAVIAALKAAGLMS